MYAKRLEKQDFFFMLTYVRGYYMRPILQGIKQCTCIVILRRFPCKGALFGLVIMTPLCQKVEIKSTLL